MADEPQVTEAEVDAEAAKRGVDIAAEAEREGVEEFVVRARIRRLLVRGLGTTVAEDVSTVSTVMDSLLARVAAREAEAAADAGISIEELRKRRDEEEAAGREEDKRKLREERQALVTRTLPAGVREMTLKTYVAKKGSPESAAVRTCIAWMKEYRSYLMTRPRPDRPPSLGFLLSGPSGTGKTHLMASVCHKLIMGGARLRFIETSRFLAELRERFGNHDFHVSTTYEAACETALLAIDDLGAERSTTWSVETLFSLLNTRLMHARPTLFTTNLSQDQLRDCAEGRRAVDGDGGIGLQRLYSRVCELSASTRVYMATTNHRKPF